MDEEVDPKDRIWIRVKRPKEGEKKVVLTADTVSYTHLLLADEQEYDTQSWADMVAAYQKAKELFERMDVSQAELEDVYKRQLSGQLKGSRGDVNTYQINKR